MHLLIGAFKTSFSTVVVEGGICSQVTQLRHIRHDSTPGTHPLNGVKNVHGTHDKAQPGIAIRLWHRERMGLCNTEKPPPYIVPTLPQPTQRKGCACAAEQRRPCQSAAARRMLQAIAQSCSQCVSTPCPVVTSSSRMVSTASTAQRKTHGVLDSGGAARHSMPCS